MDIDFDCLFLWQHQNLSHQHISGIYERAYRDLGELTHLKQKRGKDYWKRLRQNDEIKGVFLKKEAKGRKGYKVFKPSKIFPNSVILPSECT